MAETAIIIGAGPAGLTAALEFTRRSSIVPLVLEKSEYMGGIARTVNYKGNRIDIGGHRFFSKSDRVMKWWLGILPIESDAASGGFTITYQNTSREISELGQSADPEVTDAVMLVRKRKSRIFFNRKFFDYPIRLSSGTLKNLGVIQTIRIAFSYLRAMLQPIRPEANLEQFLINRFGRELYKTFFKSYTEKVWGIACDQIDAEWGAQRIKGLSILKAATHFAKQMLRGSKQRDIGQKNVETSLIEKFLYPKLGPGQMWDEVARLVCGSGGRVMTRIKVVRVRTKGKRILGIDVQDERTGLTRSIEGDYFFSTMPMQELIKALDCEVPPAVREISEGLMYRDFITVGLLAKELKIRDRGKPVEDNWIYIQEPDVLVGRLQIFNNWSPYLVADPDTVWIGLEYFCNQGDSLWNRTEEELIQLAKVEMEKIGILDSSLVLDACVVRMPKAYPAYFGTYDRISEVQDWFMQFENLYLVGRNGMHKYNNQDHSMLTAMTAVDNILQKRKEHSNIWAVNTEQEYHESKAAAASAS